MLLTAVYHACVVGSQEDLLDSLQDLLLFNGLASACQFSDAISGGHKGLHSSRRDDGRLMVGNRVICTMHQLRKIIARVQTREWGASFLNTIMQAMQIGHTPGGGVLSWQELGISFLSSTWMPSSANFITYLNVSGNRLLAIETEVLKALPALRVLDLSRNMLDRLPSDHIWSAKLWQKLEVLRVDRNRIKQLPTYLAQLPSLMVFSASHNQITGLDAAPWCTPQLADVNLSHNQLTELPLGIAQAPSLHRLRLRNNRIERLRHVAQWKCRNLAELDLSENPLVNSEALQPLATAVPNLQEMSLAGTGMTLYTGMGRLLSTCVVNMCCEQVLCTVISVFACLMRRLPLQSAFHCSHSCKSSTSPAPRGTTTTPAGPSTYPGFQSW